MAPPDKTPYLPSPEECLREGKLILQVEPSDSGMTITDFSRSWRRAYESLCDSTPNLLGPIPEFFHDSTVISILNRPFEPFKAPSQQSKTEFESLTAAIHVTPNGQGPYSIQAIKDDALWLSKEAKCDEVVALRIVILEWQSRPASRLLENDDEEAEFTAAIASTNGGDANGSQDRQASVLGRSIIDNSQSTFDSAQERQKRLLRLFLSETTFVIRCAELLVRNWILAADIDKTGIVEAAGIGSFAATIYFNLKSDSDWEKIVKDCVDALQKRVERLESGSGWTFDDEKDLALEDMWIEAQLSQMITISQILFIETADADSIPSSATVTSFFEFYGRCRFFQDIPSVFSNHPLLTLTLQTMTCMVSTSFLVGGDLRTCIDPELEDYATTRAGHPSAGFVNDPLCVEKVNLLMLEMANAGPSPAVPSVFVWSLVLITIRESSHHSRLPAAHVPFAGRGGSSSPAPAQSDAINVYTQAWNLIAQPVNVPQAPQGYDNPVAYFASCAVDELRLFDYISQIVRVLPAFYDNATDKAIDTQARTTLLSVLKACSRMVQYGAEIVGALLSVIGGDRSYWSVLHDVMNNSFDRVAQDFLDNSGIAVGFIEEAQARFPLETAPFLTLMTTIILNASQDVDTIERNLARLQETNCFTQKIPPKFRGIDQDEQFADPEDDRVKLTADLPMFLHRRASRPSPHRSLPNSRLLLTNGVQGRDGLILKAGAQGFVPDSLAKDLVVSWWHTFSPLQYLAASLASMLPGSEQVAYGAGPEMPTEDVSSIIGLFTALLVSLSQSDSGQTDRLRAAANAILGGGLLESSPGQDLTTVIYEIFEAQLQQTLQSPSPEDSPGLLVRCIQFFHAVTLFTPSRVWPLFARSRLLDIDGDGGSLVTVVTAIEMVTGRYDLLLSCIRLFEALVDASFNDIVVRPQTQKALTRFGFQARNDMITQASPTKTKAGVIMDFLRTLVSVFESYRNWRYQSLDDRTDIGSWITKIFTKILNYAYATGNVTSATGDLTAFLKDAAGYLVARLLSSSSTPIIAPLFDIIAEGLALSNLFSRKVAAERVSKQITNVLELCVTCIRLAVFLDKKPPALQESLLRSASLLSKVYAADPRFRNPVANLFEALIQAYGHEASQPPSLLGYVGPHASKDFLTLISRLGQPEFGKNAERDLWSMLSAVVSSRQQWFAIFVLTGVPPRDRQKESKSTENLQVSRQPLLSYALDQLSGLDLEEFRSNRTIEILNFVALSLNNWPWVMGEIRKHPTFIKDICKFITKLKVDDRNDSQRGREAYYSEASAAAVVAEILAMYLHSARQLGDSKAAEQILPHLPYLWNYGAVDPPYTPSLHKNLEKNLEEQCSGLRLSSLKHTGLFRRDYGDDYFYDITIAKQVLKASDRGRSSVSNFVTDIKEANEELSILDSQIALFKQWTFLAVEIANLPSPDAETVDHLVRLTRQCLEYSESNGNGDLLEPIAEQLRDIRLNLACLLLQKGRSLPSTTKGLPDLFAVAWKTIRSLVTDFDVAYIKDADHHRLLLQILFLTIQPLANAKISADSSSNSLRLSLLGAPRQEKETERTARLDQSTDLVDVLNLVIATGFRSLATNLHESSTSSATPSDFVLLTALLQSILHIPGMTVLSAEISQIFSSNATIRYALSLFSWADQLSPSDPIYGELAILFLLELSTVPLLAESMAVEGVLASLSSANLMRYYARPNGMGPFDNPPRMHSIWARGILPLCLNLLDSVGPQIAPEVVSFLNQYPNQLQRLSAALAERSGPIGTRKGESAMTLAVAAEAHSLALIWRVVEKYRMQGPSVGLVQEVPALAWDKASAKEDADDWVNGRVTLVVRIVPGNEREAELARQRPREGVIGSRLEDRVFAELKGCVECLGDVEG